MKVFCKCGGELFDTVSLDNGHVAYDPDSKVRLESESKGGKKFLFCTCPKCGARNEIPFGATDEQIQEWLSKNPKS